MDILHVLRCAYAGLPHDFHECSTEKGVLALITHNETLTKAL
jgi:hypothetical protein